MNVERGLQGERGELGGRAARSYEALRAAGGVANSRRAPFALTPPPAARAPSARLMRLPSLQLAAPDMTVTECHRQHLEDSTGHEPPPPAPPDDADVLLGRVLAGER
ncbi:hypothetical protein HF086_003965 [Spodoptera exigua]|uniref:Uncharacterized protein n=1 Tax=Spodoptera exigua TaxID=7107 RepID=A0A922M5G0_SPOEX|nr:hypothetical protein HF086_003965 [Spodoptera exigua]